MLSTTTDCPSRPEIFSPSRRDAMSGLPPGEVGTTMRIGRCGQFASCPSAGPAASIAAAPASICRRVTDIRASPDRFSGLIFPNWPDGTSRRARTSAVIPERPE
jgi:hypothetical protein